jgi:hypothetical protein
MCNIRTMLKVAFAILVIAGMAYFVSPGLRTWIVEASPLLLFLICPISMFIAMKTMTGKNYELSRSVGPDIAGSVAHGVDK